MGIENAQYYGWKGSLGSPWRGSLAIMRIGLIQVFRRKMYWIVIALGLIQFLLFWAIIYFFTQFAQTQPMGPMAQNAVFNMLDFNSEISPHKESGYVKFMERQSIVVMLLLAFSGSLLVGADFRSRALPFYLARRIDRRHYIAGKLLAVSAVVALITVVPALLLFLEYGMFTSNFDYWIENWRVAAGILGYGFVMCAVLSILLVSLSAYLQKTAPIAITWSSLFVLLSQLAKQLAGTTDNPYWELLDPWRNMRFVGRYCFGVFPDGHDRDLARWSLLILSVVCSVALVALFRRVRAVDIVS